VLDAVSKSFDYVRKRFFVSYPSKSLRDSALISFNVKCIKGSLVNKAWMYMI